MISIQDITVVQTKHNIRVKVKCPVCGNEKEVIHDWTTADVVDLMNRYFIGREFIQDVLPEATAESREQLVSGICPECWRKMFGDDE